MSMMYNAQKEIPNLQSEAITDAEVISEETV